MGAIQKIFEDSGDRLETEQHVHPLMPKILSFFSSESPKMRFDQGLFLFMRKLSKRPFEFQRIGDELGEQHTDDQQRPY